MMTIEAINTRQPPLPRAALNVLPGVAHGALDFAELEQLGLRPEDVLDFSTNTNPYGPSPAVLKAIAGVRIDRYPDRQALALRRALAEHLDVPLDRIVAGNGSAELLWLVGLAYLQPGHRALVIGPTFGEYANISRIMGAQVDFWLAQEDADFKPNAELVRIQLQAGGYRLVFVCNPNNPTGQALPSECLASWADAAPGTLIVVDEAYLGFTEGLASAVYLDCPNVLVLRSMTKDYALTGLRLGYAVGSEPVIAALSNVRPPWNVNSLAQEAGIAALADQGHLRQSLARLQQDKIAFLDALNSIGWFAVHSMVHFFLLPVVAQDIQRWTGGARLRSALRQKGILVRDCTSFGLPNYVRIATRRHVENMRLLSAIQEVML